MYEGNPMVDSPEWEELDSLGVCDGVEWVACLRAAPRGSEWRQLKISANGYAETKANYWLGWDGRRLARSKDMVVMSLHRPELAERLRRMLLRLARRTKSAGT